DLAEAFDREHERTYGHRVVNRTEIVNLRVICRAPRPAQNGTATATSGGGAGGARTERPAYFGPRFGTMATPVLRRGHLGASPTAGPLIVEEYDATVVVPPDWTASLDHLGNIRLDARE